MSIRAESNERYVVTVQAAVCLAALVCVTTLSALCMVQPEVAVVPEPCYEGFLLSGASRTCSHELHTMEEIDDGFLCVCPSREHDGT